ncbi:hypothetical protein [Cryobacterium sp. TMB1-7]|uniref:hypothetical protein n=1 Tax=Cryobacterium sp. TMB1-7 TaxID=2555866 RepID=UPI00106CAA15|nr:hypothetical protein [Cryobacterium sp. TMB1-7]TFC59889.1 hypothetical protein E3O60_07320 [Cryobacterium sp. TMB1-7]
MIGSVLVMVIVIVVGVLLGIQPQLAAKAAADEQRESVAASNASQATVLAQLERDFEGLDELKADLEPLHDSVPNTTEMPAFVKQLGVLAERSQVVLSGFTVSDAVPYAPVEVVAAEDAGETTEPSATNRAPTEGAVDAPLAGVPPVTNAQITAGNFVSLTVTVTVNGSYGNALEFVNGLQTGERLVLVSGVTTTAETVEEGESNVTALITGLVYVLLPDAPTELAPAE